MIAILCLASPSHAGENASAYADLSWERAQVVADRSLIPVDAFPLYIRLHGVASARAIGVHLRWFPRTIGGRCYELVDGPPSDTCGTLVGLPPGGSGDDTVYTGSIRFFSPPSGDVCVTAWLAHEDCAGIQPARFYVADLMIEDQYGERDHLPIANEATILEGVGIEQPVAVQAAGRTWLIPGSLSAFHVSGIGFDSTSTVSLVGPAGTAVADVALDSPRSLSVSFDLPEAFVGQAILVVGNGSGPLDTLASTICLFDTTAATGSGVNGSGACLDKLAPGGVWRKSPGDSTWNFVPAIPESVLAMGPMQTSAYLRAHSTSSGAVTPGRARRRETAAAPAVAPRRSAARPAAVEADYYDVTRLFLANFEDAYGWAWSWNAPRTLDAPTWGRVTSSCAKVLGGTASLSPSGDPGQGHAPYCFGYSGEPANGNGYSDITQTSSTTVASYKSARLSFWRWLDTHLDTSDDAHTDWFLWYYSTDDGTSYVPVDAYGLAGEDRVWRKVLHTLDTGGGSVESVKLLLRFVPQGGSGFIALPNDSGLFVDDVAIEGVPYPNITYWRPDNPGSEWSSPIVVAAHPTATSDEPVAAGQTTYIRFGLQNNSYSGTERSFGVRLNVEGKGDVFDQQVGPLAPGQKWSTTVPVAIPTDFCGSHAVKLTMDYDDEVREQDEGSFDNSYTKYSTWTQSAKPDLRIVTAWADPLTPCAGEPSTLSVVVQNLGTAGSGPAQVSAAPSGAGLCTSPAIGTVGQLAPGASDTITAAVTSSTPTTRWYDFAVDCPDWIDEGCEESENNNAYGPVEVIWTQPAADLVVSSFGAADPSVTVGQAVQIAVTIANAGQVSTPQHWAFDWYQDLSSPPVPGQGGASRYTVTGSLAPASDTTIVLSRTSNTTGTWHMYVRVNANGVVHECLDAGANNVAGPSVLTWLSESLLVRGRFTYRDTGYVRDGAPIGAGSYAVHPLRGARVAIMDRNIQAPDRVLGTTCTDDQGNFALSLPSRYDPERGPIEDAPQHVVDVYARALLNADEVCAGLPAINVKRWSDTTTWSFDSPVHMDVSTDVLELGEMSPPLGPSSYGIRSAMHIYETILRAAQRMREYGFEPVTYPAQQAWRTFVRWEPGGGSGLIDATRSLSHHDTIYVVGRKHLGNNVFTPDEWDNYVLLHEYGHQLARMGGFAYTLPPELVPDTSCSKHFVGDPIICPTGVRNHGLAWDEGWGMFVGVFLDSAGASSRYWDLGYDGDEALWYRTHDLEDGKGTFAKIDALLLGTYPSVNDSGPAFEGANAGVLWDWIDAANDDQNPNGCDDHLTEEFERLIATLVSVEFGWPVDSLVKLYMAYQHRYLSSDLPRSRALFEVLCEHGFWSEGADRDTTGYVTVDPSVAGPPRLAALPSPTTGRVLFRVIAAIPPEGPAPIITIFDVAGRLLWKTSAEERTPGVWEAAWHGETGAGAGVQPGVYFARCKTGGAQLRRTLVVRR